MPNIRDIMARLDSYNRQISSFRSNLQENMLDSNMLKPQKDEIQESIEKQIAIVENFKRQALEELVRFPPHKERHFQFLTDFYRDGEFDKSVFIMTKFPDVQNPQPIDNELSRVIQAVKDAIAAKGFIPRIANARAFHAALWNNVELYLLGCSRGVAIVEDKYKKELNPNVTMEWGWMRGMDRRVLYLIESNFIGERADIIGLLKEYFDWNNPEPGVANGINGWLQ